MSFRHHSNVQVMRIGPLLHLLVLLGVTACQSISPQPPENWPYQIFSKPFISEKAFVIEDERPNTTTYIVEELTTLTLSKTELLLKNSQLQKKYDIALRRDGVILPADHSRLKPYGYYDHVHQRILWQGMWFYYR